MPRLEYVGNRLVVLLDEAEIVDVKAKKQKSKEGKITLTDIAEQQDLLLSILTENYPREV